MKILHFSILYAVCLEGLFSFRYQLFCTFNNLKTASNSLDRMMFADNTSLFISDENINTRFTNANLELQKMN